MATLEQILGYRNLTGVIQATTSGLPLILPPAFLATGRRFSGNRAEYFKIFGSRKTAKIVQYGAPAIRREMAEVDSTWITLLHSFESQQWPLALTIALTKMNELAQDRMGEEQAEYQTSVFKKRFVNLRQVATMLALFKGIIYIDANNNIVSTAATNGYSIDYGVPDNNKNQLNGIISTKWDDAAAKIMTQLLNLYTAAGKLSGYPLKYAFYGDNVPGYISTNTEAQAYLIRNPAMNQQYINTGTIPNGFGGIENWVRAGNAFWNDDGGTNRALIGADDVVFTPAPDTNWFETFEGSFPVPTSIMPVMGNDARQMLSQVSEQFGMFGYGRLTLNPPTVEQFAGDTFLPTLKINDSIFQATVHF